MDLSDNDFRDQLQSRFGYRLGYFEPEGRRARYPLVAVESMSKVHGRVVIIGNAAHTVHPVAGQGFNLALRDIADLADHVSRIDDPGETRGLKAFEALRQQDLDRVFRFTDVLVNVFSNKLLPLAHMRAAGLLSVDLMPFVRHALAKQSMGLNENRHGQVHG